MKKFVVIYHAPTSVMEQMANATPEQMQEGMKPWMEWKARCGEGLVDLGAPIVGGQKLSKSGNSTSDQSVVGYSILQAENIEGAKALLEGHPHLEWASGCEIKVYETMQLPM